MVISFCGPNVLTARVLKAPCTIVRSVCLSVTMVDQDHVGGKYWKLIARSISQTPSLFVVQRPSTYTQGNIGKFWSRVGKSGVLAHKSGNISETRKDRAKFTRSKEGL